MILFVVDTPNQLLNALAIKHCFYKNDVCDLYYGDSVSEHIKLLKSSNEFRCYYAILRIDRKFKTKNRFLKRIKMSINIRKHSGMLELNPLNYDIVFLSGINLNTVINYYLIKSINKRIKLNIYEEGICEYYNLGKRHLLHRLYSFFFFRRYYYLDCEKLFVYNPLFVDCIFKNVSTIQIPSFFSENELLDKIVSVFLPLPLPKMNIKKKFIFLDQTMDGNELYETKQKKLIGTILSIVGPDNLIVKLHPRSPKAKYGDKIQYLDFSGPFELFCALQANLKETVFVSIASSSIANLKLIFSSNAPIILLNKMLPPDSKCNPAANLFDRIIALDNSKTIKTPNNEKDFILAVESCINGTTN